MLNGKKIFFTAAAGLIFIAIMAFGVPAPQKEVKLVYFIVKSSDSSFWKTAIEGAETAAREYNVVLVIKAPLAEDNYIAQNRFIDEALKNSADAIVFAASDYDMSVEYAEKAMNAGLNFVVIDSDINSKKKTAFIGTDNLEACKKAAETIAELTGNDANIGIISCKEGEGVGIQRTKFFTDYINETLGAAITDVAYSESNIQSPMELTMEMLGEHPEINAVFTVNEWATLGAGRAVDELGLGDGITVVAFDNNIESVKMLENGVIDTLVVQNPFAIGYLGVQKAIESKKNIYNEPEFIYTGTVLINRENMYDAGNQKLLFPFSYKN